MSNFGGGRSSGGGRPQGRHGGGARRTFQRKKACRFCLNAANKIDYKDVKNLRYFVTERGKIVPRRISGNCAKHQRIVSLSIKRARNVALLPYSAVSI